MKVRGLSLLEVLLTIMLLVVTLGATLRALGQGLKFEHSLEASRSSADGTILFEEPLAELIRGADLSDARSSFVSPIPDSSTSGPTDPSNQVLPPGSSSLVFTTWNSPPPQPYLARSQASWEGLNAKYGAQGSIEQVSLSLTPVGDAGTQLGLFLRRQRPPQADISKGGLERLYSPVVKDIRFEFYDGTTWVTDWDSRSGTQKGKLPQCVRVTYLLNSEKTSHGFTVRLSNAAPVQSGGSS